MSDDAGTIVILCRDPEIKERLPLVHPPQHLSLQFRSGLDLEAIATASDGLAQIVISPGGLGIGAQEAELIALLCDHKLEPIVFLFNPEEEKDDQDLIESAARRWTAKHQPTVRIRSGGQPELIAVLEDLVKERARLVEARAVRLAAKSHAIRIANDIQANQGLKAQLADYVNIRLECDAISKRAKQFENAVESAFAEALQRINETALIIRSREALDTELRALNPDEWATVVPHILADVTTQWQADQIDNMLRDVRRFCPVQVDVQQQRVDGGVQLMTSVRPLIGYDMSQGLLKTGSAALLASAVVSTILAPVAFLALPAALVSGFLMFRKTIRDSDAATRQRFIADLSAYLSDVGRTAAIEVRRLLKAASEAVKEQVISEKDARISELLRSSRAMSDEEAAEIARRLRDLAPEA